MNDVNYVTLINLQTGRLQPFRFDVVTKLFKFERQQLKVKCWDLPEDSNYTYTDGKLTRKQSNRINQTAKKW